MLPPAAITSLASGLVCSGIAGWMLVRPASFAAAVKAFPRSILASRILTLVVVFWLVRLVQAFPLDKYEYLKSYLPVVAVILFGLLVWFLDELLAARALGGLLQLIGLPIVDAIRFHDSPLPLALMAGVYVLVVAGMILILSPYRFRHFFEWMHRKPGRVAAWGASLGLYGAFLVVIGLTVLP